MKKRLLFTMVALALMTATVFAVPAKPGLKKKVTLKDGSTIELTLRGDEHFSFYTDAANKAFLLKDGALISLTQEEVAQKWNDNKQRRLELAGQSNKRRAAHRAGKPSSVTTGNQHGLVILVEFPDREFVTPNPQKTFHRFFNEEGYKEGGMAGSVRDYFKKQSYNKLTIDFDVVGPFTTVNNMAYYGKHYKDDNGNDHEDTHPVLMVREAVDAAEKAGVDFSKYDWDKDGEVDQVFVIFAGYNEAQGADDETIWPHEWSLSAEKQQVQYDGVWIKTYGCASELSGYEGAEMDGIGTACHEFSHCLGLPDMYDTNTGENYGTWLWDVMCNGSYLDESRTPAGYSSYERWFSGWLEPVEIKEMTRIKGMKPLATHPEAYVLYNEKNKNEYYLLENRQLVDFDSKLYGHGMLILHIDYDEIVWQNNKVNIVADRQRVTIIPADNDFDYSLEGIQGDPWPGRTGNTQLTNYSTPKAILYNKNIDGQLLMNKPIDNITEDTDNNTISFVACRPELGIPDPSDGVEQEGSNSFSVKWQKVTGATSYEIELTTLNRASSDPAKALQNEFDFKDCYSEKDGYTDISTKLGSYGLPGWSGAILFTSPNLLKMGTSTKTGWVKTDTWKVPQSTDMTVVMGANVVKDPVDGKISITYGNEGESVSTAGKQEASFTVTADGKQVFTFKDIRKDLFWLEINPTKQMYLNYLAIYDGIWTAEQLGINTESSSRRAGSEPETFTTTKNKYTFTDLDTSKRFVYRVRAVGEENTFSLWSEEKSFEFGTTGIGYLPVKVKETGSVRYFNLQGQEVNGTAKGLVIRKQGGETKKVMMK
jgi:M6 family metalloprotease-like protein